MAESTIRCVRCQAELAAGATHCACGALGEVLPPPPALRGDALKQAFRERRMAVRGPDRSGVFRYRDLVCPELPLEQMVTRGEGNTGLYPSARLAAWVGLRGGTLAVKHEGENPTGSFKDRGMCLGVSHALASGAKLLACASTGNTSSSLASYAALAGVPCVVFVPAGKISSGKLAQTLAYGARVLEVEGSFDTAMQAVEEASAAFGLGLLNSVNPWRIEGQKAIGIELLDDLDWEVPDWIVLPAGNLGNISALGKALRECQAAGLIDRLPRVACVQAEGASPLVRHFAARAQGNSPAFLKEDNPETYATAIRIGDPRSWEKAVRELDHLQGRVIAASDQQILDAKAQVDAAGIGCEPASAASVAGVKQLVEGGVIAADARVVTITTGHVLKDPLTTAGYHDASLAGIEPAYPATRVTVEATLDGIRAGLGDLLG